MSGRLAGPEVGTRGAGAGDSPVAWVDGEPVDVGTVDERERELRAGPGRAALPRVDTSEGRQLRRWLVQLIAAERLVRREAARLGVTAQTAPELAALAADSAALLELGSVPAALLARDPLARAVFVAVTAGVRVEEAEVARYHADNPERFGRPECRLVRHAVLTGPDLEPALAARPVRTLRRGELTGPVEDAVFGAAPGAVVGPVRDPLGWHVLRLEAVRPATARPLADAEAELLAARRRRSFTAWLDGRTAEQVVLAEGYEHPGDPAQPDNTHRH
ncbi:peptidylprolyl isomerase [Actinophytocola sp.]|uniref:peptidylprolyl isomerase n=1 Tax=Actinophytocola sp. TaxID=1872138 RepID=UPI002D7F46D8|nr:peptidylprolyl isomerase [Actinophytocola sp.]HET9144305.1 peptidylprolyl isomerase [Actinophytocola sp.]